MCRRKLPLYFTYSYLEKYLDSNRQISYNYLMYLCVKHLCKYIGNQYN